MPAAIGGLKGFELKNPLLKATTDPYTCTSFFIKIPMSLYYGRSQLDWAGGIEENSREK